MYVDPAQHLRYCLTFSVGRSFSLNRCAQLLPPSLGEEDSAFLGAWAGACLPCLFGLGKRDSAFLGAWAGSAYPAYSAWLKRTVRSWEHGRELAYRVYSVWLKRTMRSLKHGLNLHRRDRARLQQEETALSFVFYLSIFRIIIFIHEGINNCKQLDACPSVFPPARHTLKAVGDWKSLQQWS